MAIHYVYILHSLSHDVYYKGYTTHPELRLEQHNTGQSRYTANKGPWKLVFLCQFANKKEALQFEKMLKRQNRRYLDWLIDSERNSL